MNKFTLLAATLASALTFSAQAGELYSPQQYQDSGSTLTRAQVKQTVLQERKTGELNHNDVDLPNNGLATDSKSSFGRTRASVKAETLVAAHNGELEHDDADLPVTAKGSVLTRQAVRAEALAARPLNGPPARSEF